MKHRVTLLFLAFFFVLFLVSLTTAAKAQVSENSVLFKTVMALDDQLFNDGFNRCRLDRFEPLIADDLAFFHDASGVQHRGEFLSSFKQKICSNRNSKPMRTLLPGSSQVFILRDNGVLYGAIQQGVHRFHRKGQKPSVTGYTEAKFSHFWILNKGQWQLKNALSYDHRQIAPGSGSPWAVKKKEPEPYTIYDLTLLGHSLRLDYRAMMD